ncbi:MAG: glycosyltransferase family 4 protein, partial [Anaerolineaceae bacterium]|nr:glycosyltransferase family 4 protein [Anaerolineaceae bacterium]
VRIVRAPVLFRLSKGVIMPTIGHLVNKLVLQHDAILLHLPQFDAAGIAFRGRLLRKPTVITYHCDVRLPPGGVSWAANQAVRVMNNLAAIFTHRIVNSTRDYAENSAFLRRYLSKLDIIFPPVEMLRASQPAIDTFARQHNLQQSRPVIGMAARFATEKGVEVLLDALPDVIKMYPQAVVLFTGPYQNIIGEQAYYRRLAPRIESYKKSGTWKFLGVIGMEEMAAYFSNLDVLALPSLNSTEAFGMVQIEALLNGIPTVVSDLPGVRQPVRMYGYGRVVPVGDSGALADALQTVLANPKPQPPDLEEIAHAYHPDTIAQEYEAVFERISRQLHR